MAQAMRFMIKDFLNVSPDKSTAKYSGMSTGFSNLDEQQSIQTTEKTYISDTSSTTVVRSINTEFPFTTDVYTDDETIMFLHNIFRNKKTGMACVTDYVRTDIVVNESGIPESGVAPARKFSVSVQVDSEKGGGGEPLVMSGKLLQRGNFVDGTFDFSKNEFKPQ